MGVEVLLHRDNPVPFVCKKRRSKLPQRRRSQLPPVRCSPHKSKVSAVSVELSSFSGAISVGTSSDAYKCNGISSTRKRQLDELRVSGRGLNKASRPCSGIKDIEFGWITEFSESSCCESSAGVYFGERSSKLQATSTIFHHSRKIGENDVSESVALSGMSCAHQNSPEKSVEFSSKLRSGISVSAVENGEEKRNPVDLDDDGVSVTSALELCHKADIVTSQTENRASNLQSTISNLNAAAAIDEKPKSYDYDSELACTEKLSYDDVLDYSSSQDESFSDLQSEIFQESSDYFSYSSFDSGSVFSEKSSEDSTPSKTFALLLQYREQFVRSTNTTLGKNTKSTDINKEVRLGFDDEEDATSYRMLRNRERNQVYLRNYEEEYSDSIMEQRSRVVYWMMEQSKAKELQKETMFLGVTLFDRFLSIGSFQNKRNFQIVGIACLALATRIEENQPYNSVRQRIFHLGNNTYSRIEVVAMEWLVQEVLNFQCALPTTYNFLWFYLKAARVNNEVEKRAKELAALALMDHEHLGYWPSSVAAALVILASLDDAPCQRVIQTHVRTKDDDLPQCIESLKWLVEYIR